MRTPIIVGVTFLAAALIACSGSSNGTGTGTSGGATSGGATSGGATSGGAAGGAPECGPSCTYYLQCKGPEADTPTNQATCVKACADQGVTSEQLQAIDGLDCPAYVSAFDGSKPPGSSGSSGKPPKGPDCDGCQHDGTSCILISPSTGLYSQCAASCC